MKIIRESDPNYPENLIGLKGSPKKIYVRGKLLKTDRLAVAIVGTRDVTSYGKEITEKTVTDIVKAAGVDVDSSRVKALISALKDVNIDDAIKNAAVVQTAAPAAATAAGSAEPAKKEKEEEKKTEEEAAQGLSSLFG